MLTRRRFVRYSALSSAVLACPSWLRSGFGQTLPGTTQRPLRLAILGSVYHLGSNLQTIGDRFLVGYPQEGDWHMPNVQVVSMYVDQRVRRAHAAPTEFERVMSGTDGEPRNCAPRGIRRPRKARSNPSKGSHPIKGNHRKLWKRLVR